MSTKKTLLSWSSGKDSAWALQALKGDPGYEVAGLLVSMNQRRARVSMHATRWTLLERQARVLGLPLWPLWLPEPCSNEQYQAVLRKTLLRAAEQGITAVAFGDLFLEDIRRYREAQLQDTGIEPLFPLWGRPTWELAHQMLEAGVTAYVTSVDLKRLPRSLVGQKWSGELLAELPPGCDPCGENGEFHTVVVSGPMFPEPIPVEVGEIVERDGFAYADLRLAEDL